MDAIRNSSSSLDIRGFLFYCLSKITFTNYLLFYSRFTANQSLKEGLARSRVLFITILLFHLSPFPGWLSQPLSLIVGRSVPSIFIVHFVHQVFKRVGLYLFLDATIHPYLFNKLLTVKIYKPVMKKIVFYTSAI